MGLPRLGVAFHLAVGLLCPGCATRAVRPSTPAAQVRFQDLSNERAPGVRYYSLIFASQSVPKLPRFCHTWASVVQVTERGDGQPPSLDTHTISWMPASLQVRLYRCRVESGANLDLQATLHQVQSHCKRISVWGPYELQPGLYQKFLMQKAFMESGQVGYQAIDGIGEAGRTGRGCDCIHAITDMDSQLGRSSYSLRYVGDDATQNIVRIVWQRGGFMQPEQTHDWLIPALGLAGRVVQRDYGGP